MLLDTVRRHDARGSVKLVCIEGLQAAGRKLPPQVQSVPALVVAMEGSDGKGRKVLFGKQVFDYLLLPGTGRLIMQGQMAPVHGGQGGQGAEPTPASDDGLEPSAYALHMTSKSMSDSFCMIEDDTHPMHGMEDRSYQWTSLSDPSPPPPPSADAPFQEETRSKKGLPDVDTLRVQRELDLKQSDLNTNQLPPPSFTR